ncbi:MAG: type I phosphomannose isomerase catalytic subunit [Anaerolineae bacterium]
MTEPALYPIKLKPALHTRVWGGRRLETVMGKALPTDEPYGEAWEMHDTAVVANGGYAGKSVAETLSIMGEALVGSGNPVNQGMPLLAKFIDASDWLSVQVHPNDAQASELEGEPRGKSEAWIVLDSEPGARIVIGVAPGTTREAMADAIQNNTLEALLVYQEVVAGDVLNVEANIVHALGPGLLIYEIQQSSDTTYRLYDWGRMGLDGKARALHVDKGVQVAETRFVPAISHSDPNAAYVELVRGPYFVTAQAILPDSPVTFETEGRFQIITCIEGEGVVRAGGGSVVFEKGQTLLIPAACPVFSLRGDGRVLISHQP